MKALRLAGVRDALVIAPHPDDEAIGAYGLIRTLRLRGARVRLIVVADGAASHPGSARWPRARLVRERRRETRFAMRRIGLAAAEIVFLGLPDGGLQAAGRSVPTAISRAVARAARADLVVLPAADDDHPDHRAVARAAGRSRRGRAIEYLVWPNRARRSRRATLSLVLGGMTAAKRAAILRYRTQTGGITDDPAGFAISRAELAGFARPRECYREL